MICVRADGFVVWPHQLQFEAIAQFIWFNRSLNAFS